MRRRLLRLALLSVVVPVALEAVDYVADRLEASGGPTSATRTMRRASTVGRRLSRRG